MTGRRVPPTFRCTERKKEVFTVDVLTGIFVLVLMFPVLLLIAVALGPALLVILFVILCALPVLLVAGLIVRHSEKTRMPPMPR